MSDELKAKLKPLLEMVRTSAGFDLDEVLAQIHQAYTEAGYEDPQKMNAAIGGLREAITQMIASDIETKHVVLDTLQSVRKNIEEL